MPMRWLPYSGTEPLFESGLNFTRIVFMLTLSEEDVTGGTKGGTKGGTNMVLNSLQMAVLKMIIDDSRISIDTVAARMNINSSNFLSGLF